MTWEVTAAIGVAVYVVPAAVVGFYYVVRSFLTPPIFPGHSFFLSSDARAAAVVDEGNGFKEKMRPMVIGLLWLGSVDLMLRVWAYFFRG